MEIYNISDMENFLKNNQQKVVFISGVTGQDGSYMVDYLLENTDYKIIGGARRLSVENHKNLEHLKLNEKAKERFRLVNFDLTDSHSIDKLVCTIKPDYFINLAAQSFVKSSWDFPAQTFECNTMAIIHELEAIRKYKPDCRFYQAGSSEEFGDVIYTPQDEIHPLRPRSPYGASKVSARQIVKVYRESYNLFAIAGFLFNHESERRGEEFVTRKITKGVARLNYAYKNNIEELKYPIELGNIEAQRDWSHSLDFVDGIWKMLNNKEPIEYVLSSNDSHSIKEFVKSAFDYTDLDKDGYWHNNNFSNKLDTWYNCNIDGKNEKMVVINPNYYRPAEVNILQGDSNRARKELNWKPKISFNELVKRMVEHDIDNFKL